MYKRQTLYHWDLPQALQDAGGWPERDTAARFVDYALTVQQALGDLVHHWTTFNEPYCTSIVGYAEGRHAPGAREGHGALAAAHHLMLAHGTAVRAMREQGRAEHRFGIVLNQSPAVPVSADPADVAAARRMDCLLRRQFTDPLFGGAYPEDFTETFGAITDASFRQDGDLEIIGTPLDYLGINYYYRLHVADAPHRQPDPALRSANDIGVDTSWRPDVPLSGMGWPVEPEGLTDTLTDLAARYPGLPPIYLTENGGVFPEHRNADGVIADPDRIAFLDGHLRAAHRAVESGVDVRGYFCWSLLDNFEWAHGYKHRFGLVHVDYDTLERTPRASFAWYRDAVAAQRG